MNNQQLNNRMLEARPRGRPPKDNPVPPFQPVEPACIVPFICPLCGRAQTPSVLRKLKDGKRECRCNSCGRTMVYEPAKVRPK